MFSVALMNLGSSDSDVKLEDASFQLMHVKLFLNVKLSWEQAVNLRISHSREGVSSC